MHITGHEKLTEASVGSYIGDCNHQFGLGSSLCSNVRTDSIRKKLVTTWGAEFNARDVERCNSGLLKGWRGVNSCISNHNNIE